jgi:EAL and modified HD-GYP domain-containing signal transduction protein
MSSGFFMARQPIYDRDVRLVAYELLYRGTASSVEAKLGGLEDLSALSNILVDVGLDRLSGNKQAFINVPQSLLGSDALRLLPPDRVTLEILEDTEWNSDVEAQFAALKDLHYELALDDYTFEERHEPFLNHVSLVKVDVLGACPDQLRHGVQKLKQRGLAVLAEKVEDQEMMEACLKMGFDLFQGYFLSKPKTMQGTGIPANYSLSISLLAKLQNPDISMDELEQLMVGNVALCHKLLRLVNSAATGLGRHVDSIKQAIMFLGTARIRTLASLAVVSSLPGKPPDLYALALIRARCCESLAREAEFASPEMHFTTGLLSVLDALTDIPMQILLEELPLCPEIEAALAGRTAVSPCARTLSHVLHLERGDWTSAERSLDLRSSKTYVDAVDWAHEQEARLAA